MSNRTDINEVINLLHDFAPQTIKSLKSRFPKFHELIDDGVLLGDEDENELEVRAEICKTGLMFIKNKSEKLIPKMRRKLSILDKVQLFSNFTSVIGGAAIITMLQEGNDFLKYLFSILILIGALASLLVKHFSGNSSLKFHSLTKTFDTLIDNKILADHLLNELNIKMKFRTDESGKEISELINKSNELSLKTRSLIEKLGVGEK